MPMKVAIIGGGAAGLMSAAILLEAAPKAEIFIIDKNDGLGKKVIISGGGRCNVTTGIQDIKVVLTKYPRGGKFLTSAMHKFSPSDVYQWFESHGVPLKIEADSRVFPRSNDGHDVVGVFEKLFKKSDVKLVLNTQVINIKKIGKSFEVELKDEPPLLVDKVILTTGGQAYRQTGSTGDGYAFATSLGHTITELAPSLSALFTQETWPAKIAGLSFQSVSLGPEGRLGRLGRLRTSGPILFTHKGISGPAVFALSSLIAFEKFDAKHPLEIVVDLLPDKKVSDLTSSIEAIKLANPRKSWLNILAEFVPKSLAEVICLELKIDGEKKSHDVSKKDLARCMDWLKGVPLHIISRSAGDEFVTAGGVNLKEVDPTTMQSKICPGLYFAGEILDIDGFTGGFNLQASWATGHLAGTSASHH
ncbi:MAG: NAD(P)/FAD-dependent oxidoreductase [Patescibacteria group bacterium]|nr:NAD(P)/FAD-dependent oxidoreductase [Patescibacteria group bacterium]